MSSIVPTEDGRFSDKTLRYLESVDRRLDGVDPGRIAERIVELTRVQGERRRRTLNMIPAENTLSRRARALLDSDLVTRLTEGFPGDKEFPPARHNIEIDEIEAILIALVRRLFRVRHVEWRPTNTTMANTVAYAALTAPGDTMLVQSMDGGGNMNYHPHAIPRILGLQVVDLPGTRTFELDLDGTRELATRHRPKVIVIGGGYALFPYPLTELRRIADSVGARIFFDAAHLSLLVATGRFQVPLSEGADIMGLSTQKVLGGPVGGMALTNDDELARRMLGYTFPVLLQTRDLNKYAAQAHAMAEMVAFGDAYAEQMVKNAVALARALEAEGFTVIGAERGYTRTHQVVLDLIDTGAEPFETACQAAGILVHKGRIMGDGARGFRTGARLTVQELTRQGMGEAEMAQVARLIRRAALDRESSAAVEADVAALTEAFGTVRFSFDQAEPA